MKVIAVIAIRNEEKYLEVTLQHLVDGGIRLAIINNGSEDRSLEILKRFDQFIDHYEYLPYHGSFDMTKQIESKSKVIQKLDADWIIHHDADEVLQSNRKNESLKEGIERVDNDGCTAINFDEFVFIPTNQQPSFEGRNFYEEMLNYYFFEPKPNRLMRAWKNNAGISQEGSGHALKSVQPLQFPAHSFLLRHYIVLSQHHANEKYGKRIFAEGDIAKGWHQRRLKFPSEVAFPDESLLHRLPNFSSIDFCKDTAWNKHFWQL